MALWLEAPERRGKPTERRGTEKWEKETRFPRPFFCPSSFCQKSVRPGQRRGHQQIVRFDRSSFWCCIRLHCPLQSGSTHAGAHQLQQVLPELFAPKAPTAAKHLQIRLIRFFLSSPFQPPLEFQASACGIRQHPVFAEQTVHLEPSGARAKTHNLMGDPSIRPVPRSQHVGRMAAAEHPRGSVRPGRCDRGPVAVRWDNGGGETDTAVRDGLGDQERGRDASSGLRDASHPPQKPWLAF